MVRTVFPRRNDCVLSLNCTRSMSLATRVRSDQQCHALPCFMFFISVFRLTVLSHCAVFVLHNGFGVSFSFQSHRLRAQEKNSPLPSLVTCIGVFRVTFPSHEPMCPFRLRLWYLHFTVSLTTRVRVNKSVPRHTLCPSVSIFSGSHFRLMAQCVPE